MTKIEICDVAGASSFSEANAPDLLGRNDKICRTAPRSLDPTSPTFGDDLHLIFCANVAKARRANVKVIGASDVVIGT